MTSEQVLRHLDTMGATPKSRKLVGRIIDKMGLEPFARANEADCLAAYRTVRPGSSVDIGKTGKEVIKMAQRFIATVKYDEACRAQAEQKARLDADREKAERERKEAEEAKRRNPMFSQKEIKLLSDMMELHSLEAIDLVGIKAFLDCVKFKETPCAQA